MEAFEHKKHLTEEELSALVKSANKPGMRFTVDMYLLDYIKHCFLEEGQLDSNINKLENAILHIQDDAIKQDVKDVLSCLRCVDSEYKEYLEDVKSLGSLAFQGSSAG